jgi:phosphoribosylglycinamide formyltransferase-1
MKNIAIFASGSGTNYEAIMEHVESGDIKANVVLMATDHEDAYVVTRAKNHNTPIFVINYKGRKKEEYEAELVDKLKELKVDLIVLAGYMRFCGKVLLDAYEGYIINIHPALLPAFKGAHGIEDAYNYGVKVFGVTVHYVDSGVDSGKIIAQRAFDYTEGETLEEVEARIHKIEHVLYPEVIKNLLK